MLALLLAALVCTCGATLDVGSWCEVHQRGTIGGLTITNRYLFDVLDAHGHDVDVSTFPCVSCQRAIASDGFCDEHRTGFVHKRAYFSWLTYSLAHGPRVEPATLTCPRCRKNATSFGWCDRDRVGIIANVAFPDRAAYDRTLAALAVVKLANEQAPRCQYCAAAIVTDTECPFCRISYKNGRKVPH